MEINFSQSELNGLSLIEDNTRNILSIGISTAGVAEVEMCNRNKDCHVIATTIDVEGYENTKEMIDSKGLSNNILVKLEDVKDKMIYPDNYFDFIYARLIFHYLKDKELKEVLKEVYRVLKKKF